MSDESNYEVGYKKPPKHTQFTTGDCPRRWRTGRPKGSRNLKTDLKEALSARIPIREGGRTRRISAQQALLKRLLAKALSGDVRAIERLIELALRLLPEDAPEGAAPPTAEEAEILARFIEEIRRRQGDADPAPDPDSASDEPGPEEPQT
jgi:hypothetical protein